MTSTLLVLNTFIKKRINTESRRAQLRVASRSSPRRVWTQRTRLLLALHSNTKHTRHVKHGSFNHHGATTIVWSDLGQLTSADHVWSSADIHGQRAILHSARNTTVAPLWHAFLLRDSFRCKKCCADTNILTYLRTTHRNSFSATKLQVVLTHVCNEATMLHRQPFGPPVNGRRHPPLVSLPTLVSRICCRRRW